MASQLQDGGQVRTERDSVLAEGDERSDVHMKMGIVAACRWHMNIKLREEKKKISLSRSTFGRR